MKSFFTILTHVSIMMQTCVSLPLVSVCQSHSKLLLALCYDGFQLDLRRQWPVNIFGCGRVSLISSSMETGYVKKCALLHVRERTKTWTWI